MSNNYAQKVSPVDANVGCKQAEEPIRLGEVLGALEEQQDNMYKITYEICCRLTGEVPCVEPEGEVNGYVHRLQRLLRNNSIIIDKLVMFMDGF